MRTLAALVFIAGVAAGAVYLSQRPTIASGNVMAADLMEQLAGKGITSMNCDDEIPIGATGAVFRCSVAASDGSTARIEYKMNREGGYSGSVVGSPPRVPTSGDPWSN
jgi:hypothetical protein